MYIHFYQQQQQGYLNKVRLEKNLFTAADAETIFGNIEELYQFHKDFLKELQQVIQFERMEESSVGDLFIKHVSFHEIIFYIPNET